MQVVLCTALVAGVVYGSVRFLRWELQRQQQLLASGTHTSMAGLLVTLSLLMAVAFGNSYAATRYLPIDSSDYAYIAGPTYAADVVGTSREFVMRKVGPPEGVRVSSNSESWAYRDGNDNLVRDAIVFAGDNVVACSREHPVLAKSKADTSKPHAGQSMDVFVREYGPPVKRAEGSRMTQFTFENGMTVMVRDGRVLGVR